MNAIVDEHAQHACYSPSSAHRWTVCTASAQAIAKLPPQEDTEESLAGTEAHNEFERVMGGTPLDTDHPSALLVALARSYISQLPPGQTWCEHRVYLTEHIWGRLDFGHWEEATGTVTILDLKNGFLGVDAEENEQLRIYAAALIQQHKLPVKWIRYCVVQPNDFRPVPSVKQWGESAASLQAWTTTTAAIPYGEMLFKAGEHCRDCPLFGICDPTKDILVHLGTMMARGPSGDVPAAMIPIFMACKKPIEHFFEGLMKGGTKKALQGDIPPGMKLVTATRHRAWTDEVAAKQIVFETKGIDGLKAPTPAQAEDMGIDVSELAKTPDGGPTLAFADDKRKPWAPKTAAEMFKDVPGVGA